MERLDRSMRRKRWLQCPCEDVVQGVEEAASISHQPAEHRVARMGEGPFLRSREAWRESAARNRKQRPGMTLVLNGGREGQHLYGRRIPVKANLPRPANRGDVAGYLVPSGTSGPKTRAARPGRADHYPVGHLGRVGAAAFRRGDAGPHREGDPPGPVPDAWSIPERGGGPRAS